MDVVQNRWPECKVIVGLAPPRGDNDRCAFIQSAINSELRLMERSVDFIDMDDFGLDGYPNVNYYTDHIHLNHTGVSMYTSRLKRHIHTALNI
jgi:hypothetical protein